MFQPDVDCSPNPYDLRPAVGAVGAAKNRMLAELPEGGKLVIVAGERHHRHAETIFQHALIAAHIEEAKNSGMPPSLIVSEELPHNLDTGKFFSPVTTARKRMHGFCAANGISVHFNDLAIKEDILHHRNLDDNDPVTKTAINAFRPALSGNRIRAADFNPPGIAIRNHAMVERTINDMEETNARLSFLFCGRAHVFGYRDKKLPFEESIVGMLAAKNIAVLPVVINNGDSFKNFPVEAEEMLRNAIKINGLSKETFSSMDRFLRARINRASHLDL